MNRALDKYIDNWHASAVHVLFVLIPTEACSWTLKYFTGITAIASVDGIARPFCPAESMIHSCRKTFMSLAVKGSVPVYAVRSTLNYIPMSTYIQLICRKISLTASCQQRCSWCCLWCQKAEKCRFWVLIFVFGFFTSTAPTTDQVFQNYQQFQHCSIAI